LEPASAPVRSQGKQAAVRSNGNQHKRKLHPSHVALLEQIAEHFSKLFHHRAPRSANAS
jgi:hypothetical protein